MEMMQVKFGDLVRQAVKKRDAEQCGRIAERLWCKHRLNYDDTFKFVHELTRIELPEWDELLRQAEYLEGHR